jgi:hypothetical protein
MIDAEHLMDQSISTPHFDARSLALQPVPMVNSYYSGAELSV